MASRLPSYRVQGFSLVEMLVALVFTMILMAGMATVFKSSLSSLYTTGEKISSTRRNHMSTDLLYEDLNSAGMTLLDLTSPITSGPINPAFYVIPNVLVTNAATGDFPTSPATTDELYLTFDQPLAFEGKLTTGGGTYSGGTEVGSTAVDKVLQGGTLSIGTDNTYVIDCGDSVYAASVTAGMYMLLKSDMSSSALQILTATAEGSSVTVTTATSASLATQITGQGDSGTLRNNRLVTGSGVIFFTPGQMVRYRIVMLDMDPDTTNRPNGIPCLVREQGTYDYTHAFEPVPAMTQIITENVAGFKVYLSANAGKDWAGSSVTANYDSGDAYGWTNGIQPVLNTQLATIGRTDYTDTSDPAWYRNIPVTVRLDITTRTATKRTDYNAGFTPQAPVATHKFLTQSLVILPRHFGLPLN